MMVGEVAVESVRGVEGSALMSTARSGSYRRPTSDHRIRDFARFDNLGIHFSTTGRLCTKYG
jgi:hypothetical protein